MPRRRFVTADQLAAETGGTVDEVLALVRAGRLKILAPPRRVTSKIPDVIERGGGLDLGGKLASAEQGLKVWLTAYLERAKPLGKPQQAADENRPYTDGIRVYVRPDAMAATLHDQFFPPPRADRIAVELKQAGAIRGTALGLGPNTEGARLVWWRLPSPLVDRVLEQ